MYYPSNTLPHFFTFKRLLKSILKIFSLLKYPLYPSAANNYRITPFKERLNALEMVSLDRRRMNSSIIFIYDVINGQANCPTIRRDLIVDTNDRNLRHIDYIKIIDKKMKRALTAPLPYMCKNANKVADIFKESMTRKNFISMLRSSPNVFT